MTVNDIHKLNRIGFAFLLSQNLPPITRGAARKFEWILNETVRGC